MKRLHRTEMIVRVKSTGDKEKMRLFHEQQAEASAHFGACGLAWLALGCGNERNYTYRENQSAAQAGPR
jgi:hypothetical protein